MPAADTMLTRSQTLRILRALWYTPTPWGWGLPVLFGSKPGAGKTSGIVDEAAAAGLGRAEVLAPGERGEGAFGVVPVPDTDLGVLTYPAPDWAARFTRPDSVGVVFVDEITTADLSLQPALLGLTLARRIGGAQLARRVRVVAAGNLAGQGAANATPLSAANANRFVHLPWPQTDVPGFTGFLAARDVFAQMREAAPVALDAAAEEARVEAAWPLAYSAAAGLVAGFLAGHAAHLHQMPDEGSDAASGAWPSPRTWDMATLALAGATVHSLTADEVDAVVAGLVGDAAAADFAAYRAALDLPDVAAVLDGRASWTPSPQRPDITYAVLGTVAALVTPKTADRRASRMAAAWKLVREVCASTPDAAVACVQSLVAAGGFDPKNIDARTVLGTAGIHAMLQAAGMVK